MTEACADASRELAGRRICMTLWSGLRHDARVVRAAAALAEAGADVTVIAANWEEPLQRRERHELGFEVIGIRRPEPLAFRGDAGGSRPGAAAVLWHYLRTLAGQMRLLRALWRVEADVVHAHDILPLAVSWLVARLRGRALVYDAHEISTDRPAEQRIPAIPALVRAVEGFVARRATAMITTTRMRAEHFAAQYGIEAPTVVQNRPLYRPVGPTDRLREALPIPDAAPIFLYQGGLQPGRGLPELIERMAEVPGAHLVLMGPGNLHRALFAQARSLGLAERVHLPPPVPWEELGAWTASADVGVQLIQNTGINHYTTDSNKIFEYAMAGLPVIASDFPEIRRVVSGHGFGLLVDPGDAAAVTQALRRLAGDSGLRARLGEAARRAAPELSWETQLPALLGLYRKVLAV